MAKAAVKAVRRGARKTEAPPSKRAPARVTQAPVAFNPGEAAALGAFVSAAYSMYAADPSDLTPDPTPDFPATYELFAWVQMRDFVLASTDPVFYGFIAKSMSDATQFLLAIRGTETGVEWWDDATSLAKVPFAAGGNVGLGFSRIYETLEVVLRPGASLVARGAAPQSLRAHGSFAAQVAAAVAADGASTTRSRVRAVSPAPPSISVVGHSLGSALATLYTMDNAASVALQTPRLYTFASPLVGDRDFASAFATLPMQSWRIANSADLVTKLPPAILGFVHVETLVGVDSGGSVRPSLSCWHSLATYLHLLDSSYPVPTECAIGASPTAMLRMHALAGAPEPGVGVSISIVVRGQAHLSVNEVSQS